MKVKETKPPAFVQRFKNIEFHIRKFPNKDAREQFFDMMKEAQNVKVWMKPLQTQAKIEQQQLDSANVLKGGAGGVGIKQIRQNIERQSQSNQKEIGSAFSDLKSLKEKSKGMVTIASQIKNQIKKKELTDNEMSEIQEVMFNMGMTDNFTSHVSKDISGKKFY